MGIFGWWLITTIIAVSIATFFICYRIRLAMWHRLFLRAKREFRWQRERLEAKFVQIGQQRAGSAIRRWGNCDFDDEVTFVRSRVNGQLSAFVSVEITLESIFSSIEAHEDDLISPFLAEPQQKIVRNATGIFVYNKSHWDTTGRTIYNLSPSETIRFYRRDLEAVTE